MSYELYIDDVRPIPFGMVGARSSAQAIQIIATKGMPSGISFDHDLGDDDTAMVVVNWIIEKDTQSNFTFIPEGFDYYVHSMNPIGRQNLQSKLDNYMNFRNRMK